MAKLHELIAVYGDAQGTAAKINTEAAHTFSKKPELFIGTVTTLRHFDEADRVLDLDETKEMTTTVPDKLAYVTKPNVRYFDVYLQKEEANQRAKADIIIDDLTLVKDVPATVLLGLEKKLAALRAVYDALPTLAPGATWEPDPSSKLPGVYRSVHPDIRGRTRKTVKPVVLVPATKEHPAQVEKVTEDVPIGRITVQTYSGMTTSATKSELLGRLDRLIAGVKKARQRANSVDVKKDLRIGHDLMRYIHGDLVAT